MVLNDGMTDAADDRPTTHDEGDHPTREDVPETTDGTSGESGPGLADDVEEAVTASGHDPLDEVAENDAEVRRIL